MIINLLESDFFTKDPDIRFAREYLLPNGTWKELWRRYKLLEYTNQDLRDYLFIKHARNLSAKSVDRWIARNEIYLLAQPAVNMGAKMVNTSIFGKYEQKVIDDLTKQIRWGGGKKSNIII